MKHAPAALLLLVFVLAACDLAGDDQGTPVSTPAITATAPLETPAPAGPIATSATVTPAATQGMTLTLWTTTEIAPNSDVAGGTALLEQLSAFDNERSGVTLLVELKTISDQGGTLSYLRTGRSVAPSILPDVILLPASELASAASQGLIFPLNDVIDDGAVEDLYDVARDLVEIEDQIYGYPISLTNLQHLTYDNQIITETVSLNWNSLVSEPPGTLLYPAAGATGAQFTSSLYQAFGGAFVDESGQPALQAEPLTEALTLVERGVAEGLIDTRSGNTGTLEQAWQLFEEDPTHLLQTTAEFHLSQLGDANSERLRAVSLPGPGTPLTPTVGAWTWAISTPDPERQVVAAELINTLATAQNVGDWCLQSFSVPARRAAFDQWPESPYAAFLQREITQASPTATGLSNSMLTILSDATTAVILGLSTPAESAEQAIASLQS